MRPARAAILVVLAGLCLPCSAAAQERLGLSEARSAAFPERSYVVSLPEAQRVTSGSVVVRENGEPVENLRVAGDGGRAAIVLAIDASESMHDEAIVEAMRAARVFAERRRPNQPLGVVFFSREPTIALEPTTDGAAIAKVLAQPPPLTQGTRVFDATAAAIEMIERAGVPSGSVVVVSDGADVGSAHSSSEVVDQARAAHVRLFGVGLRSSISFNSTSLRALSASGGTYAEAGSAAGLSAVYSRLGERLGREFQISYRSAQPLGSTVAVAVSVSGIRDVATAAYEAPALHVPPGRAEPEPSWWESGTASAAAVLAVMMLLGLGLAMVLRPAQPSLARRIEEFTAETSSRTAESEQDYAHHARAVLASADHRLEKWKPWTEFKLDVELASIDWQPGRIVGITAGATALLVGLFLLAGSYLFALLALVLLPLIVRTVVRYLSTKTRRRFEDQLPDNLQVLASALRAGHSFIGALGVMVKDAPKPSDAEFHRVVRDEQLGVPVEQSLEVVHERMRCEDVIYVGLIATLQRETGGNTAEVLDKVVETMRERGKIRRLVRTLTAQGRLGGWIVTALPIAMIVFLNVFSPDYMDPMLDKTVGWVILIFAALMVALGSYCIRRIVDIKV